MMSDLTATYVRQDGEVLAFFEGRVIASGGDFKKVEETAVDYLENLSKGRKNTAEEKVKKAATHILTPNGEKAQILSRVDGLWGEKEITVRTEKGRIVKLAAHAGNEDQIQYHNERIASVSNPIEALQKALDEDYSRDKASLAARIAQLQEIRGEASGYLTKGASYADEKALDTIVISAEHEQEEIGEALAYLKSADAEAFEAPAPYDTGAVEQAELGGAKDNSWLDHTVQEMIDESEDVDYDKMLAEGPGQFAADLDNGAIADQGATAEMAMAHVTAKTASFKGEAVEAYRQQFIAATEMARRAELKDRQQTNHKQAAVKEKENVEGPDDVLFM